MSDLRHLVQEERDFRTLGPAVRAGTVQTNPTLIGVGIHRATRNYGSSTPVKLCIFIGGVNHYTATNLKHQSSKPSNCRMNPSPNWRRRESASSPSGS